MKIKPITKNIVHLADTRPTEEPQPFGRGTENLEL